MQRKDAKSEPAISGRSQKAIWRQYWKRVIVTRLKRPRKGFVLATMRIVTSDKVYTGLKRPRKGFVLATPRGAAMGLKCPRKGFVLATIRLPPPSPCGPWLKRPRKGLVLATRRRQPRQTDATV